MNIAQKNTVQVFFKAIIIFSLATFIARASEIDTFAQKYQEKNDFWWIKFKYQHQNQ